MNPIIKTASKLLTSGELVQLLDKDGDGKISWEEIKTAPLSVWIEILYKYGSAVISTLYFTS